MLMDGNRNRLSLVMLMVLGIALLAAPVFLNAKVAIMNTSDSAALPQRHADDPVLGTAVRFERGGWIYVHLEGSPHDIGYQHGYLLASEIPHAFACLPLNAMQSHGIDA